MRRWVRSIWGIAVAMIAVSCSQVAQDDTPEPNVPPETAIVSLLHRADSLGQQGRPDSALAAVSRAGNLTDGAGEISDRLKGEVLYRLGRCYFAVKLYDSAAFNFTEALTIADSIRADTLTSNVLIQLGRTSSYLGEWDRAVDCLRKALVIKEKIYGPNDTALAFPILTLLKLYYRNYRSMDAEPLSRRLESIATTAPGAPDSLLIDAGFYQGWVAENQWQYGEAQKCYLRAISAAERQTPVHYSTLADIYGMLSEAYRGGWNIAAAREAAQRALAIAEKHLGSNNSSISRAMMRLATIYSEDGRFDLAESYFRRALAIRQASPRVIIEEVIQSVYALAYLYRSQNRYTEAIAYCRMASDLALQQSGSADPEFLRYQYALAELYTAAGQPLEAEKVLLERMPAFEKVLGRGNYVSVWAVDNLATVWAQQGRNTEAESLLLQKLNILEEAYGPRYCYVAYLVGALTNFYLVAGEGEKARQYGERLLALRQDLAEMVFTLSSENQKLSWVRQNPLIIQDLVTLALDHPGRQIDSVAFNMVLRGKALVGDAVMQENEAAYCTMDPVVMEAVKSRATYCTAIADLSVNDQGNLFPDSVRETLGRLYDSLETVETELSRRCSDFETALTKRRVSVPQVAAQLPPGSVLWEFVKFKVEFKYSYSPESYDSVPIPDRYIVFTLDRPGRITLTDLGEARGIDSLIIQVRRMIYDAEGRIYSPMAPYLEERLKEVTRALYDRLIAPIAATTTGVTGIFVAPDDLLNLLPFEILTEPDESYLIEHFNVSYLSSGRDLTEFDRRPSPGREALILGDPDYDWGGAGLSADREKDHKIFASLTTPNPPLRSGEVLSPARRCFLPLPYCREEMRAIAATIRHTGTTVREWSGAEAREDALKSIADPPRILHVSTHGFFEPARGGAANQSLDNPLLRSGLALAGANRPASPFSQDTVTSENGILTAFEVSGLNLQGTELVTLSGCETGMGEPSAGEGVFGLRRAFLHAGAQSVVMSLWNVPDRETAQLMARFYEFWLGGMTRREALRAAALEILRKTRAEKGHGHPLLWGGFVMAGNPW